MPRRGRQGILFFGALLITLVGATPSEVHAQDAEVSTGELETVIVTARRREENIMDVPAAVTAINADTLRNQEIRVTEDIQLLTPGLTEERNASDPTQSVFNIRGQGITSGGTGNPSVLPYIDEIPAGNLIAPVYDLESVQVFKGPQGTLFGATLTGGAVMFTTKRPVMDRFEGFVQADFGNYNEKEFQGAVNVPIVPGMLAIRLAGDVDRRSGYTQVINLGIDLDDRHSESFRASARFQPIDALSNDTIFDYYNSHTNGGGVVLGGIDTNPNCAPPANFLNLVCIVGVPAAEAAIAAQQARGPRAILLTPPPPGVSLDDWLTDRARTYSVTNITKYDLSKHFTLRNLFGNVWIDQLNPSQGSDDDGSILPGFHFNVGTVPGGAGANKQLSDEFQVLGDFQDVANFVAGAYVQHNTSPAGNLRTFYFPLFSSQIINLPSGSLQKAVYAQTTLHGDMLGLDRFSLTLGGRDTWVNTRANIGSPSGEEDTSSNGLTYSVSLDYKPSEAWLFYLAHRTGFKPGGSNTGLILPANAGDYLAFAPEKVKDVEIGVKNQVSVGNVRGTTDLDFYNQWYTDIQRNDVIDASTTAVTNAKRAIIKGIELDTSWALTKHVRVAGFFSWTDPKFTNYIQPDFGNGLATTRVTFQDLSGTQFAGVAKISYSLTAAYDLPVIPEDEGTISLSGTYFHQSTIYTTDANIGIPSAADPGYGIGRARLEWHDVWGSRFDASLYVNNLSNRVYKNGGTAAVFLSQGFTWTNYGEPRMFGVELRYSF